MEVKIKRYESKDEEKLGYLLSLCYEEEHLVNVLNSSKLKFAYSAFFDNEFIGIMIAWTSSFHPFCTYFRIISNPFYKRMRIEEKLLSKIEKLENKATPLQTSFWETSDNIKNIYKKNGFIEIRRTYMPHLRLSDVKNEIPINSENNVIKSLKEVVSEEALFEKLTHVVKRNYENTHLANPVVASGIEDWKKTILADDVVLSGSYVCIDIEEKDILAYSFLHESDKQSTLELGWCGASEEKNIELITQLTYQQISYAHKHDIEFIIGEFDTTDKYGMEVLSFFPFEPCPTWITVQKK